MEKVLEKKVLMDKREDSRDKLVGKPIKKVDYEAILLGEKSYTGDFAEDKDLLHIKVLRSPHAFAKIEKIDKENAMKVPGVVEIFTYEDVPNNRYTECGENFPESSPHDRLILEQTLRYVGDDVAIIAAETEEAAERARNIIKVEYEVYEPILTVEDALKDDAQRIHPEDDGYEPFDFGYDPTKNIVCDFDYGHGDVDKAMEESEVIVESGYSSQAQAHAMMETLRAYARIDEKGRLEMISASQSIYHMRRQVAQALGLKLGQVRMKRVRIGGGFGGKNVAIAEPIAGFVTWMTKRPSYVYYDRDENFSATTTRHAMEFKTKIGAMKDGTIKAIDIEGYNNSGAYGGNGPAVTMEAGQNTLPLYGDVEAIKYKGIAAYTNTVTAGALRGYGTPQGSLALDGTMNELAAKLDMDPIDIKLKNTVRTGSKGGILPQPIASLNIEECLAEGKEMIGWDDKRGKDYGTDRLARGVGMSVATHSCGVSNVDSSKIRVRLEEDGSFMLFTGSADLGTGSDTMLSQIACDALNITMDDLVLVTGDTDSCPYDTGAYASCTTYLSGNAIVKACNSLIEKIIEYGASRLEEDPKDLEYTGKVVRRKDNHDVSVDLWQLGIDSAVGMTANPIEAIESFSIGHTPRPFIAGYAEVEVNKITGEIKLVEYVSPIDCGQVINPNLTTIQAEGGAAQGIGFALYEDVFYRDDGHLMTDNFLHYTIPTRNDIGKITVDFFPEKEPTGPYGAKSIGELIVNSPAPAILDAIYDATGIRIKDLPVNQNTMLERLSEVDEVG